MGGQCHVPATLRLRKRPSTHCTGGWVGPRAGQDRCGKSHPPPGFDPWTFQPVASRYINYTIPALGYHMYRQETRLSSSFYHSIMMTRAWERKKITNVKSSCTIMPLKVGLMFWTACEGIDLYEIEALALKLFLSLTDVACVNASVLWILKYPNWQQKKNN